MQIEPFSTCMCQAHVFLDLSFHVEFRTAGERVCLEYALEAGKVPLQVFASTILRICESVPGPRSSHWDEHRAHTPRADRSSSWHGPARLLAAACRRCEPWCRSQIYLQHKRWWTARDLALKF
jgi:hypothetical protein